jgi:hypothetical protein
MAMNSTELKKCIYDAWKSELDVWREELRDAIDSLQAPAIPATLDKRMEGTFKAATWLNFSMDAVKNLAPKSGAATALSRYSPHIWAASIVVDGVKKVYEENAKHFNLLLKKESSSYKKLLLGGIIQIERDFPNSSFGRTVSDQVFTIAQQRMDQIVDERMAESYVRGLIAESKVLDDKRNPVGTRAKEQFATMSKKVTDFFLGTKSAWGRDAVYFVDPTKQKCDPNGYRVNYDPFTKSNKVCAPKSTAITFWNFESDKYAKVLANLWRLETQYRDVPLSFDDETYVWSIKNPQSPNKLLATAMEIGIAKALPDMNDIEPKVWQHVLNSKAGVVQPGVADGTFTL